MLWQVHLGRRRKRTTDSQQSRLPLSCHTFMNCDPLPSSEIRKREVRCPRSAFFFLPIYLNRPLTFTFHCHFLCHLGSNIVPARII
ncbi:hypothetical protein BDW71DRAFT_35892 [Aspergillus fruticulosus]